LAYEPKRKKLSEFIGFGVEIKNLPISNPDPKSEIIMPRLTREQVEKIVAAAYPKRPNLNGADLSGLDLNGANLMGADLVETNLSGANLSEAMLGGADLRRANLRGATLAGAGLVKADLREVDLSQADLSEAVLRGAKYNHMTRWPAGFDPASAGATHEE
jgi:hypothetical protein